MNKQKGNSSSGLPIGMCLGIAVGTAIGGATKNMGLWMPLGVSFGALAGLLFSHSGQSGADEAPPEETNPIRRICDMPAPTSLIEGFSLASPAEDLKTARRVEQYRVSGEALYIPAGFRWNYIPFSAIRTAEESHFSVTAGKCVAVTEKRPSLHLETAGGSFDLSLEKAASLQTLLDAIRKDA